MRIIHDSDTRDWEDGSGDRLVLLVAPRQRDVERSDEIEQEHALKQLETLKRAGVDTDAVVNEASQEDIAKARAQAASELPAAAVRAHRFKALALKAVIGGEAYSGQKLLEAYRDMDSESARWIDETVQSVWASALPSDAQREGETPDVDVLESTSEGAAE